MNEELLQNIWNHLSTSGKTPNNFETWKINFLQDSNTQDNVFNYLSESNLTSSSREEWNQTINRIWSIYKRFCYICYERIINSFQKCYRII